MIFSVGVGKAFGTKNKNQYPFTIYFLSKLELEMNYLNLITDMYPQSYIPKRKYCKNIFYLQYPHYWWQLVLLF